MFTLLLVQESIGTSGSSRWHRYSSVTLVKKPLSSANT